MDVEADVQSLRDDKREHVRRLERLQSSASKQKAVLESSRSELKQTSQSLSEVQTRLATLTSSYSKHHGDVSNVIVSLSDALKLEVKRYHKPPAAILQLAHVVCIVLDSAREDMEWKDCQHVLSDPELGQKLSTQLHYEVGQFVVVYVPFLLAFASDFWLASSFQLSVVCFSDFVSLFSVCTCS